MVLDRINQANDIKYLNEAQLEELPGEIRQFLIEHISKTGGHLASNLGVVELTMALHLVLNFPEDKLIWDVGHQSYTHKILTGRKREFEHLRQLDGISGFRNALRVIVMLLTPDTVLLLSQQVLDMRKPEIFWERTIMWYLLLVMVH